MIYSGNLWAGRTIGLILATHKVVKTKPLTGKIIKGIALTVPVLAILAASVVLVRGWV